jgi:hypothetical protein
VGLAFLYVLLLSLKKDHPDRNGDGQILRFHSRIETPQIAFGCELDAILLETSILRENDGTMR